jgi:hypothetical protein
VGYARAVFLWGEVDMLWCEGVVELLRWRRRRRSARLACDGSARLVAEVEAFLAGQPSPPAL